VLSYLLLRLLPQSHQKVFIRVIHQFSSLKLTEHRNTACHILIFIFSVLPVNIPRQSKYITINKNLCLFCIGFDWYCPFKSSHIGNEAFKLIPLFNSSNLVTMSSLFAKVGHVCWTANVDYRYRLPTKENKLPFSICRKQT
jgi:hypothetical protein